MTGFSRQFRLTKKHEFAAVFAKSQKATSKFLLVLYKPNALAHARLGMIVSKRYLKRAVDRNWLRRTVRESFRQGQVPLKGLDLVVLMRSEWCPQERKALRVDVANLWETLLKRLAKS